MSDSIKHECGIAMIRLLKPVDFYLKKYGSALYGLNKMHLLMEKQHNRGQDGAGLANIKLYPEPGCVYIDRERSNTATPIKDVFQRIESRIAEATAKNPERLRDAQWLKRHVGFTGEVFLGHLRYGTFGKNNIENVHPVSRENNWMTRSLVLAGNFNLTNIDELFDRLIEEGSADFLLQDGGASADERWASAARFVDNLSRKRSTRFDDMTKAEIKLDRLAAKGLV